MRDNGPHDNDPTVELVLEDETPPPRGHIGHADNQPYLNVAGNLVMATEHHVVATRNLYDAIREANYPVGAVLRREDAARPKRRIRRDETNRLRRCGI